MPDLCKLPHGNIVRSMTDAQSFSSQGESAFSVFDALARPLHEARRQAQQGLKHPAVQANPKYAQALQAATQRIQSVFDALPKLSDL